MEPPLDAESLTRSGVRKERHIGNNGRQSQKGKDGIIPPKMKILVNVSYKCLGKKRHHLVNEEKDETKVGYHGLTILIV